MKTLKIAIAALIISAGTISAFAFTKADQKETNSKFTTTYYTLDPVSGMYERAGNAQPDLQNCKAGSTHKCVIGFNSDQGPSLSPTSLPGTPSYQSPSNGVYSE